MAALLVMALPLAACGSPTVQETPSPEGRWRAYVASPGGEIPFVMRISRAGGDGWAASVFNGTEEVPFTTVEIDGQRLRLAVDHYDSVIEATLSDNGRRLDGTWQRQAGRERSSMMFAAVRGESPRFDPRGGMGGPGDAGSVPDITGEWETTFTDDTETFPALGLFRLDGATVAATFQTSTGDYRFLAGDYREGMLRLSTFNGSQAYLFTARAMPDGTLSGDFWSRASYHATWKARRRTDDAPVLPDEWTLTTLARPDARLSFTFPGIDGKPVSLSDERFQGKAVVVDLFGSWCPNSNDEAPLLAQLYERYRDRGLEIVGLAYEMTGDASRDAAFVRRYARRHGIEYPLLLAGITDKAEASRTMPALSAVKAFPTAIFIGRDGHVAAIHSGFSGPATGELHERLAERYREIVEEILGE